MLAKRGASTGSRRGAQAGHQHLRLVTRSQGLMRYAAISEAISEGNVA